MSTTLQLSQLTADFLESEDCATQLPEVWALSQAVENNGGHHHQSVLTHTQSVMRGMEQITVGAFLPSSDRAVLTAYLHQKIGQQSRMNLLRLVVTAHDLAKGATLLSDSHQQTRCPAHELLGAGMVPQLQQRFGLEIAEMQWVQRIVRLHGMPHDLLTVVLQKPDQAEQFYHWFVSGSDGLALELMILVYADIEGGDLTKLNEPEYTARASLCQRWLQRLVRTVA